jgi:hypothetical protein
MKNILATLFLATTLSFGFGCAHKKSHDCSGKQCKMSKKEHKHHGNHEHKEGKKCDLKKGKKACCDSKKKS